MFSMLKKIEGIGDEAAERTNKVQYTIHSGYSYGQGQL